MLWEHEGSVRFRMPRCFCMGVYVTTFHITEGIPELPHILTELAKTSKYIFTNFVFTNDCVCAKIKTDKQLVTLIPGNVVQINSEGFVEKRETEWLT